MHGVRCIGLALLALLPGVAAAVDLPAPHSLAVTVRHALTGGASAGNQSIALPVPHMLTTTVRHLAGGRSGAAPVRRASMPSSHTLTVRVRRGPGLKRKPTVKIVRVIPQSGMNPFDADNPAGTPTTVSAPPPAAVIAPCGQTFPGTVLANVGPLGNGTLYQGVFVDPVGNTCSMVAGNSASPNKVLTLDVFVPANPQASLQGAVSFNTANWSVVSASAPGAPTQPTISPPGGVSPLYPDTITFITARYLPTGAQYTFQILFFSAFTSVTGGVSIQ